MSTFTKVAIVAAVAVAVAGTVVIKQTGNTASEQMKTTNIESGSGGTDKNESQKDASQEKALPRLVDLGSQTCVPCKMMEPILEELKNEYEDTFSVEFIDVRENRKKAEKYNVQVIPTQIFYDAEGNELFRHEGFFSKEDILKTWKTHGVDLGKVEPSKREE